MNKCNATFGNVVFKNISIISPANFIYSPVFDGTQNYLLFYNIEFDNVTWIINKMTADFSLFYIQDYNVILIFSNMTFKNIYFRK